MGPRLSGALAGILVTDASETGQAPLAGQVNAFERALIELGFAQRRRQCQRGLYRADIAQADDVSQDAEVWVGGGGVSVVGLQFGLESLREAPKQQVKFKPITCATLIGD